MLKSFDIIKYNTCHLLNTENTEDWPIRGQCLRHGICLAQSEAGIPEGAIRIDSCRWLPAGHRDIQERFDPGMGLGYKLYRVLQNPDNAASTLPAWPLPSPW